MVLAATRAVLFPRSWNKAMVGGRIDVIVEGVSDDGGRTAHSNLETGTYPRY